MSEETKAKINYGRILLISVFLVIALASAFTIADPDTDPVIIENVSVYTLDSSVIIYWDTSILADSLVKYGLTPENLTETDYLGVHSYSHASEIYGLSPNTMYYFVVNSTNANGNSNESEIFYFTTLEDNVSPSYSNISVNPLSNYNYTKNQTYVFKATWIDNGLIENVTILHNFKSSNENGASNESNSSNQTEQLMIRINGTNTYEYAINDLVAGNYSWQIKAVDSAGNEQISQQYSYFVNKSAPSISLLLNGAEQQLNIEQKSFVNITGLLSEGDLILNSMQLVVRNITAILNQTSLINISNNSGTISLVHYFDVPGIYNVSLIYNESENYLSKTKEYVVNVTPIELNLFIDKPEYNLGDAVNYVVLAPNSSNLSIEVCGPLPTGAGFVECRTLINNVQNNYPYANLETVTNKTGNYRIRAQIQYKGLTKYNDKNYTVVNNMQLSVSGDTIVKIGKESALTASVIGGVGAISYNWTLSNGTKISGQNLNVKYNVAGSYPVVLVANDAQGNYKTTTVTLVVKKYYVIKVLVLDDADNEIIDSARVKMESESDTTDLDGYAVFDLIEGSYDMRVSYSGYSSYSATINSDSNKTITVKLSKLALNSNEPLEISPLAPINNVAMNTKLVNFNAYVDLGGNVEATCIFYVAEDNNDWYRAMKTLSVKTSGQISHSEEFAGGNYFSWKVQCDTSLKTYSSPIWKFTSVVSQEDSDATLTILGSEDGQIIDAGEIRRRIDLALSNIDTLDVESKKDAEALRFSTNVERALRDYERAMRDISNIKYRKDLSEAEQEVKKLEHYNSLRSLELVTPLNIKNLGYQTFISYPTKEELTNISKQYQTQKNIVGKANENILAQIQNGIIITTRISNVEITYLNGNKEVITLIVKTLKITDNSTDTFLLEYIPKEFASSSDELILSSEAKVINKDPLLKLDKQDQIIYYVKGEKSLDLGQETKTILLSDNIFTTRNAITGAVTFSSVYNNIDWTSPMSLIILIIIISGAYLLYAFDIFGGLFEKSRRKWKEERIKRILNLIQDSSELLQKGELPRANLLFKEIQLVYENSPEEVRLEVYNPAIGLLDLIDAAQVDNLLRIAEGKDARNSYNISDEEKEKISSSKIMLKEAYNLLSDSLKNKYYEKLNLISEDIIKKEDAQV